MTIYNQGPGLVVLLVLAAFAIGLVSGFMAGAYVYRRNRLRD